MYNSAKIKVQGASQVKLFEFDMTLKWKVANEMPTDPGPFPGWTSQEQPPMGVSTSLCIPTLRTPPNRQTNSEINNAACHRKYLRN